MNRKENLKDSLKLFYGLGEYNTPANPIWHDRYMMAHIDREYSSEEIKQAKDELRIEFGDLKD